MRKKIISALATRFEGVDAKILGRIADNLMAAKTLETDEDINSAVEEVTFADILKSYGDARATDASKAAVSNYEKRHGLKNGKPVVQTDDDDDDDDDDDTLGGDTKKVRKTNHSKTKQNDGIAEMLAALKEELKGELQKANDSIAELRAGKVNEDRRKKLNDRIKALKESQRKAYTRLPLESYSDEDFDKLLDEIDGEVAEIVKENRAADASSFSPIFGSAGAAGDLGAKDKPSDAEIDAIVNKLI